MTVLYSEDLAQMPCAAPNCPNKGQHSAHDTMVLHAWCHPTANLAVMYENTMLRISCGECGSYITEIQVASVEP